LNGDFLKNKGRHRCDEMEAPDDGGLPPKILLMKYGTEYIPMNPDEPSDGVYEVIKNASGKILCIKNPSSDRFVKYSKGTAKKLIDLGVNGSKMQVDMVKKSKKKPIAILETAKRVNKVICKKSKNRNNRSLKSVVQSIRFSKRIENLKYGLLNDYIQPTDPEEHSGLTLDFDNMGV
jgi:hypothetical protein